MTLTPLPPHTYQNSESRKFTQEARGDYPVSQGTGPVENYLARLAPSARSAQRGALRRMAGVLAGEAVDPETFAWEGLTYPDIVRIREQLAAVLAPATLNRYAVAFRATMREAWALGLLDGETRDRLAFGFRNVRVGRLQAGRVLADGEVASLFTACAADPTPAGARDAAVVAVLLGVGLRRDEAARLQVEDLEASSFRVKGKGGVERLGPVTVTVRAWLDAWLAVRGRDPGPLFLAVRRGKVRRVGVGGAALWWIVKQRALQAGLAKPTTPHDLRRSSATAMLAGGADLAVVQRVLGHRNVQTTIRYDRRGDEAEHRAADLVHMPAPVGRGV